MNLISDREFTRRMLQTVGTVAAVVLGLAVLYAARAALMLIYISALIAMGVKNRLAGADGCLDHQRVLRLRFLRSTLRAGLPALALVVLSACSIGGGTAIYAGPSPVAVSPSPSGALLRAIWVLSPVGLSATSAINGNASPRRATGTCNLTADESMPAALGTGSMS